MPINARSHPIRAALQSFVALAVVAPGALAHSETTEDPWSPPEAQRAVEASIARDWAAVLEHTSERRGPVPTTHRLRWLRALALMEMGKPASAAGQLEGLCRALPGPLGDHCRVHRVTALLEAGGAAAEPALADLPEDDIDDFVPDMPLIRARAQIAAGLNERARETLASVEPVRAHSCSDDGEARYLRGLADWRSGRRKRARATFRELVLSCPTSRRVPAVLPLISLSLTTSEQLDLAEAFRRARHYEGATAVLDELVDSTRGAGLGVEARYQLGYLHYRLKRTAPELAIEHLTDVASAGRARAADARYHLARAHMRADDDQRAERAWRTFLKRHPRDRRG